MREKRDQKCEENQRIWRNKKSATTYSITTLSITAFGLAITKRDAPYKRHSAASVVTLNVFYAGCHHSESRGNTKDVSLPVHTWKRERDRQRRIKRRKETER
jgi:hypothetical protein